MMNPELVKKLNEDLPELKELLNFIFSEIEKLNRVDDIRFSTKEEISLEVIGRQRAIEVLLKMFEHLQNPQNRDIIIGNKEYLV